jgi:hypothetical protein
MKRREEKRREEKRREEKRREEKRREEKEYEKRDKISNNKKKIIIRKTLIFPSLDPDTNIRSDGCIDKDFTVFS